MGSSNYFNNYFNQAEQQLIDNLIVESIQIMGHEVFYCPRTINHLDELYQADDISSYNNNFLVEMYIKNVDGFTGDGRFLSKFNLEIRDEITFSIARTTFNNLIGLVTQQPRPDEGDLIFMPMNKKIYVIKYVQHEAIFYQLGALQLYDLVCEQWEYSNESLNTGIPEIDSIEANYSFNMDNFALQTEDNIVLLTEDGYSIVDPGYHLDELTLAENESLKEELQSNNVVDWSEEDPFGDRIDLDTLDNN